MQLPAVHFQDTSRLYKHIAIVLRQINIGVRQIQTTAIGNFDIGARRCTHQHIRSSGIICYKLAFNGQLLAFHIPHHAFRHGDGRVGRNSKSYARGNRLPCESGIKHNLDIICAGVGVGIGNGLAE